jgi:U3 small nucleolar RNA-associated protein 14
MAGARAIITSSSDAKLERARAGRRPGHQHKTTPDWEKKVLELTDGQGAGTSSTAASAAAENLTSQSVRPSSASSA